MPRFSYTLQVYVVYVVSLCKSQTRLFYYHLIKYSTCVGVSIDFKPLELRCSCAAAQCPKPARQKMPTLLGAQWRPASELPAAGSSLTGRHCAPKSESPKQQNTMTLPLQFQLNFNPSISQLEKPVSCRKHGSHRILGLAVLQF